MHKVVPRDPPQKRPIDPDESLLLSSPSVLENQAFNLDATDSITDESFNQFDSSNDLNRIARTNEDTVVKEKTHNNYHHGPGEA